MTKTISGADLFCGAGGTSTGMIEACEELGYSVRLTAVNHWKVAVATHHANHPSSRHLCADLDSLNPRSLYRRGQLDILWASPECTHHSIARGGKPINEQSRATAWCVVNWAEALLPGIILVENVKEFLTWGPCGANGQPLKKRKGEIFHAWVSTLRSIGYTVDWRILCAADYGDPTTRRRLFIQCVRGAHAPSRVTLGAPPRVRRKIVWPDPTHSEARKANHKMWIPARKIIDWSLKGHSIFTREDDPLVPKTMERIMKGFVRFGLEPFLVKYRGTATVGSIDQPIGAVSTSGKHHALARPYLVQLNRGRRKNGDDSGRIRSINSSFPTVCGNRGEWSLLSPYIIAIDHKGGNGSYTSSPHSPIGVVTTKQRHAVIEPYLIKYYGTAIAASIQRPFDSATSKARFGLCQPVLTDKWTTINGHKYPVVKINGKRYPLDILFRLITAKELALVQGFHASYVFTGNATEVVKQIGNAVPRNLARALVKATVSQKSKI